MSWVRAASNYEEKQDWGELVALVNKLMAQDRHFGWDTIYYTMGGDDSTPDHKKWLMDNVDVSEIMGYLKAEFGKLPTPEPHETDAATRGLNGVNPDDYQRITNLEWADIANMPALPLHDKHGVPIEPPYQITEQENRVGVHLRKVNNGSFRASDNYGIASVYGNTPREALALLYEKLTGKIPYSSSGNI